MIFSVGIDDRWISVCKEHDRVRIHSSCICHNRYEQQYSPGLISLWRMLCFSQWATELSSWYAIRLTSSVLNPSAIFVLVYSNNSPLYYAIYNVYNWLQRYEVRWLNILVYYEYKWWSINRHITINRQSHELYALTQHISPWRHTPWTMIHI